jgi:uncharacterized LabA/DUF88 family protein
MKQYQEQRVGVFVDIQNLFYSARNLYNARANFASILKEAIKNRKIIRAIAYVVKTEEFKEKSFFEALEKIGYEIRSKDLQIFIGGAKKADWDVGLAIDAIELAPKLDTIILVSGDGDYVPLVEHLQKAMGCRVEAMAFGKSASSKLKEAVDLFTDLDKQSGRYLIRKQKKHTKKR